MTDFIESKGIPSEPRLMWGKPQLPRSEVIPDKREEKQEENQDEYQDE